MERCVLKLILGVGLALSLAAGAHATSVVGTGAGSFANLSSCDNLGGSKDCRIVNTSYGSNTQVQWGSQSSSTNFKTPSTLTSTAVGINVNTDAIGVRIGQLDWYNSATLRLNNSLDVFAVNWSMAVNFTAPAGPDAQGGELFALTIKNPINPTGDSAYGLSFTDLSNLGNSFSLKGVTVSNLRYQVVDGAGSGITTFKNNVWYNDEFNNASLYILADFKGPAMPPPPPPVVTPIPEPEIYAMLGVGLGLLGWVGRRKKLKENAAA